MLIERPVMKIDRSRGLVEFSIRGALSLATIREAIDHFRASARGFVFHGFVWDLRDANISELDMPTLLEALQMHPLSVLGREKMRAAVVFGSRAGIGLGRLWASLGETLDQAERQVFEDIDSARDWVAQSHRRLPAFPMEVDGGRGIVRFNLAGTISANEIMFVGRMFGEIRKDFHLNGFVWDFRHADLSAYDYKEMARVFEANPDEIRGGGLRIAIVSTSPVDRHLLRLWERKAELYDNNERRTFDDIEAAETWVADNPVGIDAQ